MEEIERLELEMQREDERSKQQPSSSSTSNTEEGSRAAITRADVEALGSVAVSVLDGLGLSKPPKRLGLRLSELSGGWRMRAALAQVLINLDQMDVLLLDEPTNHCKSLFIAFTSLYVD